MTADSLPLAFGHQASGYAIGILVAIWGGLALYALLGGADFGGGIWSLLAAGPSREEQRRLISQAIAPVWEANHVWLIFVITGLFAAFPPAFEALSEALYFPFSMALLGIVLRGAAFAFGSPPGQSSGWIKLWQGLFGIGSVLAPLALGASAGAIAGGFVKGPGSPGVPGVFQVWTGSLPLFTAALSLTICAYLAATYLTVEAVNAKSRHLEEVFRSKALITGVITGLMAMAGLVLVREQAPLLWRGMLDRGLPFAGLSAAGGLLSLGAAYTRRYRIARITAAVAVSSVLGGWGASQWPFLILPELTVAQAAAPRDALQAIMFSIVGGGVLLAPSLYLLFRIFKAEPAPEAQHPAGHFTPGAAGGARPVLEEKGPGQISTRATKKPPG